MYRLVVLLEILIVPWLCAGNVVQELVSFKQPNPLDLTCNLAAKDDTVEWFKDNEPVIAKEKEYEIYNENNTLRILKIEPKFIGAFVCKYNNSKAEMAFNIRVRPFVMQFDKARNVIQGDPLRLDCKAWGIPAPTIAWFREETQLKADGSGKIQFKPSGGPSEMFPAVENGTVRIVEMDYPEEGNYSCIATSNIDGENLVASAYVSVNVKDKYAALWPFLGICVEVAVLCTIILIYERRRAKRIEEEERQEEAAHLNANNEARPGVGGEEVRQRK